MNNKLKLKIQKEMDSGVCLYIMFLILYWLKSKGITYAIAERSLDLALGEVRESRKNHEYDTLQDYFNHKKNRDVGDCVIDIGAHPYRAAEGFLIPKEITEPLSTGFNLDDSEYDD